MTTLVCQTLVSTLTQEIRFSQDVRYCIGSVAPYLYMHNAPAGTFTLSIKSGSTTVFSQSFTSASIKASLDTSDNYAHVFYPIVPTNPLHLERGTYSVEIGASGYTSTSSSFLAWVQQHEDLNNLLDYTPVSDDKNPLALRIKRLRNY